MPIRRQAGKPLSEPLFTWFGGAFIFATSPHWVKWLLCKPRTIQLFINRRINMFVYSLLQFCSSSIYNQTHLSIIYQKLNLEVHTRCDESCQRNGDISITIPFLPHIGFYMINTGSPRALGWMVEKIVTSWIFSGIVQQATINDILKKIPWNSTCGNYKVLHKISFLVPLSLGQIPAFPMTCSCMKQSICEPRMTIVGHIVIPQKYLVAS